MDMNKSNGWINRAYDNGRNESKVHEDDDGWNEERGSRDDCLMVATSKSREERDVNADAHDDDALYRRRARREEKRRNVALERGSELLVVGAQVEM